MHPAGTVQLWLRSQQGRHDYTLHLQQQLPDDILLPDVNLTALV